MKFGILIQARQNSSRFPNKIFAKLGSSTIFDIILKKALDIHKLNNTPIVVSTTPTSYNIIDKVNTVQRFCRGIEVFYDERLVDNNIHYRHYGAMQENNLKACVRLNGDNPMVQTEFIQELINSYRRDRVERNVYPFQYGSYHVCGIEGMLTHHGFYPDIIGVNSVPFDLEHLKYWERHSQHKIVIDSPVYRLDVRTTIDDKEDLDILNSLKLTGFENWKDVILKIEQRPDIIGRMYKQIIKNNKG